MALPRSFRRRAASSNDEGAGGREAEYSPQRMPGDELDAVFERKPFSRSSTRMTAIETAISAGWAFSVRRQRLLGTLPHDRRELLAQRLVDFLEDFTGGGRRRAAKSLPMPTS